jgi:class 3 adenylate cyclase
LPAASVAADPGTEIGDDAWGRLFVQRERLVRDCIEAHGGRIIHTGECERIGDDLAGLAVHVAARIGAAAAPGATLVSRTVSDLVASSGLAFASRGIHQLKGVPGDWSCSRPPAAQPWRACPHRLPSRDSATGSSSPRRAGHRAP